MNKQVLMVIAGIVGLFCCVCIGLWFALCWLNPMEYGAPDWVIRWQNETKASRYRSAAERGDVEAQRKFGECCFNGIGVPRDQVEAVKWYHKAAEQGDAEAQCHLAYCYYNGEGVPENKAEAVKRYRIAAKLGNIEGQWKLGVLYLNGTELPKEETEAVKWFRKAAEQDYYYAQYLLGRCYFECTGVPKDDAEATKWLQKIRWFKKADEILKEIESAHPRAPNPHWGEEVSLSR